MFDTAIGTTNPMQKAGLCPAFFYNNRHHQVVSTVTAGLTCAGWPGKLTARRVSLFAEPA
jgi:hypothetical protein